jgi:predicted metal-dependent phosphoesterase TrpH
LKVNIDLHLHTHYSDGLESPEELVARASRSGLRTIAVTDHDGIGGVQAAVDAGAGPGIRVIPGIEFSAEWIGGEAFGVEEAHTIHVLGYGIDLDSTTLTGKMREMLNNRAKRNEKLRRVFRKKDIDLSSSDLQEDSRGGFVGRRSFAAALVRKGYAASIEEAFSSGHLMGDPSVRAIRKEKINAEEAIRIIHAAGGKAFFAHPFQLEYPSLGQNQEGLRERLSYVVRSLAALGLDGLECYYPTHDQDETEFLLALADECGLLVSIGSDDHGPGARTVKRMHSFQVEVDVNRLRWIDEL